MSCLLEVEAHCTARQRNSKTPEAHWQVAGATKVVAVDDERLSAALARLVDDRRAALLAEWRIGQHQLVSAVFAREAILYQHRHLRGVGPDAMEDKVHAAEPCDTVHQFHASHRIVVEMPEPRLIELVVLADKGMRGEQKAAGAAGRIADHFARTRLHHLHDGLDQRTRGEVLARTTFHVLRVLLQPPFVGGALHVGVERRPFLLVD